MVIQHVSLKNLNLTLKNLKMPVSIVG